MRARARARGGGARRASEQRRALSPAPPLLPPLARASRLPSPPLARRSGGIFGGTLPRIECALRAYIIALHRTLSDGYVGTEECIWAIIHKRFPHLFKSSSNNSQGNHGDNCNSFSLSKQEENKINSGAAEVFKSPDLPKAPSWAAAAAAAAKPAAAGDALAGGGVRAVGGFGAKGTVA